VPELREEDPRNPQERGVSPMTNDMEYNGWTNRETWALNLWLSNDQGLYETTRERVAEAVNEHKGDTYYPYAGSDAEREHYESRIAGETVKAFVAQLVDPEEQLMTPENIITMLTYFGSLYRVNWDEIGSHFLED
jgi:hypothetical protein